MSDDEKERRKAQAMSRLLRDAWIGVEDWCAIHGVSRNTGFKAVADGQVHGAYRAGKQIRIPTALERQRLGIVAPVAPTQEAA